jgi:hypothetical protein
MCMTVLERRLLQGGVTQCTLLDVLCHAFAPMHFNAMVPLFDSFLELRETVSCNLKQSEQWASASP